MKVFLTTLILTTVATAAMVTSVWATTDENHDLHRPVAGATLQVAQATPATPSMGMGMGGPAMMSDYGDQMKAMQTMHDKMMAARTRGERNALMTEQMKLMQGGMSMMGRMGTRAMAGMPSDMAARQGMLEKHIEMMQSMMQMMVDRMPSAPSAK